MLSTVTLLCADRKNDLVIHSTEAPAQASMYVSVSVRSPVNKKTNKKKLRRQLLRQTSDKLLWSVCHCGQCNTIVDNATQRSGSTDPVQQPLPGFILYVCVVKKVVKLGK